MDQWIARFIDKMSGKSRKETGSKCHSYGNSGVPADIQKIGEVAEETECNVVPDCADFLERTPPGRSVLTHFAE